MNELDAIQNQMAALGIDVAPTQEEPVPMEWGELTDEELAMFWPGGQYDVSVEEAPMEAPMPMEWGEPQMPEYDIEELKIDIQPMLWWLPKEEFANLIIWMAEQYNLLNQEQ